MCVCAYMCAYRFKLLYVPSSKVETTGGIDDNENNALVNRRPDLVKFVNDEGGSLIALTQVRFTAACYNSAIREGLADETCISMYCGWVVAWRGRHCTAAMSPPPPLPSAGGPIQALPLAADAAELHAAELRGRADHPRRAHHLSCHHRCQPGTPVSVAAVAAHGASASNDWSARGRSLHIRMPARLAHGDGVEGQLCF